MPSTHSFPPYKYEIPVELYIEAYNIRFPRHELFPYLLDAEIFNRTDDPATGNYQMKRRIKLDVAAPKWLKSLIKISELYFVEDIQWDNATRTMEIKTTNETLRNKVHMDDITRYRPHPDNPNWTEFTQTGTAKLKVKLLGVEKKLEEFALGLYISRYDEARKLDQIMIERLLKKKEDEKMQNGKEEAPENEQAAVQIALS